MHVWHTWIEVQVFKWENKEGGIDFDKCGDGKKQGGWKTKIWWTPIKQTNKNLKSIKLSPIWLTLLLWFWNLIRIPPCLMFLHAIFLWMIWTLIDLSMKYSSKTNKQKNTYKTHHTLNYKVKYSAALILKLN